MSCPRCGAVAAYTLRITRWRDRQEFREVACDWCVHEVMCIWQNRPIYTPVPEMAHAPTRDEKAGSSCWSTAPSAPPSGAATRSSSVPNAAGNPTAAMDAAPRATGAAPAPNVTSRATRPRTPRAPCRAGMPLNARERAVMARVCEGQRTGEIARALGTTANTVSVTRWRVRHKLGAASTAEAIARYLAAYPVAAATDQKRTDHDERRGVIRRLRGWLGLA